MPHTIDPRSNAPELLDYVPAYPDNGPSVRYHLFSSADAMAAAVDNHRPQAWIRDPFEHWPEAGVTYDTAQEMTRRTGWKEGAQIIARLRDRIEANAPTLKHPVMFDVSGEEPDVERYVARIPEHMTQPDRSRTRRRPVVTLVSHMGALSSVKADALTNRAGVVAAIADAIEAGGYSAHLIGASASAASGIMSYTAFTVKDAGETLEPAHLAFRLGHVGMFRRLILGLRATDPACRPLGSGMGQTQQLPTPRDLAEQAIYVLPAVTPETQAYFATEEKAATYGLAHLLSALKIQGCLALDYDVLQHLPKAA